MVKRIYAALVLGWRFLWAVVVSGVATLHIIVRHALGRPVPQPVLVRMSFAPLSETGAALLGAMITLTPGTTTLDIDMARSELLLHMLDGSDIAGAIAGIRHDFEDCLRVLCPRGGAA